jgi:hypothetical protein
VPIPEGRDADFQIARGLAVEAYANLEYAQSMLFAQLLDTTQDRASIIFFRITNRRSRNRIISDLLEKEFGDKYDIYWQGQGGVSGQKREPGLFTLINNLDDCRNEIVHWHTAQKWDITPTGSHKRSEELRSAISLA